MKERQGRQSVKTIKANLKRVEKMLSSKYVRPADYAIRDRLARRLREAEKLSA